MFLVHVSPKGIKINQNEFTCDWSWILKEWYNLDRKGQFCENQRRKMLRSQEE